MDKKELTNFHFEEFHKYKYEIIFDITDSLENSDLSSVKNFFIYAGHNELHYFVKYHYKMVLNSLFFQNKDILIDYQKWLYKVYYHKNVDNDFFLYFNELCKNICKKYLLTKNYAKLANIYDNLSKHHNTFMKNLKDTATSLHQEKEVVEFTQILLKNDIETGEYILKEKIASLEQFLDFYSDIIYKAMKNIGWMWEDGTISVAKEHIATETLENIIIAHLESYPDSNEQEKHIFLSCAPEELHSLGTKIAANVLRKLGYKVTNLGSNIPHNEIIRAISEFSPDYIIFSATLKTSLIDIALIIDSINESDFRTHTNIEIGIAGNAFENLLTPAKMLKADFYISDLKRLISFLQIDR